MNHPGSSNVVNAGADTSTGVELGGGSELAGSPLPALVHPASSNATLNATATALRDRRCAR
jgi:hypothetical protein